MKSTLLALFSGILFFLTPQADAFTVGISSDSLQWQQLTPLPDAFGFAGVFAGVTHDALLVAGGANFPAGSNFDGHPKVWHNQIYLLPEPNGEWQTGFSLATPSAYGVSITWQNGVVCIGGGDANQHFNSVFLLEWDGNQIQQTDLPDLPGPMAFGAGVLLGETIYVAGGISTPDATAAMHTFWALDLSKPQPEWETLPAWPGPGRMLPVMAKTSQHLYLFSGTALTTDQAGNPARQLLTDGYRYNPALKTWEQLGDTPQAMVAAPGPAIPVGASHLFFLPGDDGQHAAQAAILRDNHPGFSPALYAYNHSTDTWHQQGTFPKEIPENLGPNRNAGFYPPVTTPIVLWKDAYVLPTGEIRPGVRTPLVWAGNWRTVGSAFGTTNAAVLGVYLLLLVGMGVYFATKTTSARAYFLAGQQMPWWAAGLSIFATMLSAITYLSIPATVYATDWTRFLLNMGIPLVAPIVILFFLPFYRKLDVTSAYEYLEKRFDVSLRLLGSLSFILFQLGRMGIVLLLPALALSAVTGLNLFLCIGLMGLLSTLYTVLGGMEAVIWTDVIQVFVLLGGAIAALFIIGNALPDGFAQIIEVAEARNKFTVVNPGWDLTTDSLFVIILGMLFANLLPYTTDQAVVQRYMTTASEKAARRAIWTGALVAVPASVLFFFLGTALFVFYIDFPASLAPIEKIDQLLPWFIVQEMPAGLGGLVIAGVFAAAMSSLDSSMHAISTAVTTDFIQRFKPVDNNINWLTLARWITVLLGVLGTASAMLIATWDLGLMWRIFLDITGLFLGTLGGLFSLGIFTARTTARHAWIGAAFSVACLGYLTFATSINGLLFGAVGTLICFIAGWISSLIFPAKTLPDTQGLTVFSKETALHTSA
ncbi:MAG: sodium/solute symporter [Bacteroidota bacterium]